MNNISLCVHAALSNEFSNLRCLKFFTTDITTVHGRVVVHILKNALLQLGAGDDEHSLACTLRRHMPKLRALALQLAHRENTNEVHIGNTDVWWAAVP